MQTDNTSPTDRRRLTALGLCLTFGFAVIIAQLFRYQVLMHDELLQEAISQRVKEEEIIPLRGSIHDRNGHLLATNVFRWDVSVSPNLLGNPGKFAQRIADLLGLSGDDVYGLLSQDVPWLLLARNVPQEIGEALADLQADGLICEAKAQRAYPMGELVAHVIGIVNGTGNGFYGVEGYHNQLLKGIIGILERERDPLGLPIPVEPRVTSPPEAGTSLILTLDLNIQHIALQELRRALERFEAESGTVIVMNPKTGALLAVASHPTYDPNEFASEEPGLLADPSVSSMWEPGSIFKIITWAAALDAGIIQPDMKVYDKGKLEVGGRTIENSDREAHGEVTMSEALAQSLNTVAAYISTTMGKELFYTYVRRSGFGNLTGVDLASEGPGRVKLPGDSDWYPSDLGTNSFGQGIAVTPMQMITAAAAVANQGFLPKPYIVQELITEDKQKGERSVVQIEPRMARQAISKEAAEALTEMLVEVVESEATKAQVPGYRIAGKTGTAEIPTPFGYDLKDTIVSFVGYAPADDPQFIVLVKLDRPQTSRWANRTAAPTFRAITERLLVYLQIPPDDIRLAQQ
jgi:cell division protein FtsI/penicillin-binding protein 2